MLVAFAGEAHYGSLISARDGGRLAGLGRAGRPYGAALATGAGLALKWVSAPLALFVLVRGPQWLLRRLLMLSALVLPLLITLPLVCGLEFCVPIPLQSRFVQTGRSAELILALVGLVLPFTRQANWPHDFALLLVLLVLVRRCRRRFDVFADASIASPMLLSPIMHAWYPTWLMPFSAATRQLGSRLLSLFGVQSLLALGAAASGRSFLGSPPSGSASGARSCSGW